MSKQAQDPHVRVIQTIVRALKCVPRRHREDAWQQACLAILKKQDPAAAISAYAELELDHEEKQVTQQGLDDQQLASALGVDRKTLWLLKKSCEELLRDWPAATEESTTQAQEQPDQEKIIYARQLAERLGITQRGALKKMHTWASRYGVTIVRDDPDNPRSPAGITHSDFLHVLRHEPHLSYARRHRRRAKRQHAKVICVRSIDELRCPNCGARKYRWNGIHRERQRFYFKCLLCRQHAPDKANFSVQFDASSE